LGWNIKEKMDACAPCAEAKARQKNIASNSKMKISEANDSGRIHLDISSIKLAGHVELEEAAKPYWLIMVDEKTQLKFSEFFTTKHEMIEPTCVKLTDWKTAGRNIKIIRCDNAGENIALEKRLKSSDWKSDIVFEYTGRDTPQRNSLAEVSFHTLASRGRAVMNDAQVPNEFRYILWREAFRTATLLDGLTIIEINNIKATRYIHWEGNNPKFVSNLRTWGEAGVVKLKNKRA
jgi:hypothetical protein